MPASRFRPYLTQLLHVKEPPHRTALALAVGVFIAFSPAYGFHLATVVFCTWAFRLNFVALMVGALINNPWTIVPILAATFWTGFRLLGMPDVPQMSWTHLDFQSLYRQILPYVVPFVVGGLVLSTVGAILAYPLTYWLLTQYRNRSASGPSEPDRLPPSSDVR